MKLTCADHLADMQMLAPWLAAPRPPGGDPALPARLDAGLTLQETAALLTEAGLDPSFHAAGEQAAQRLLTLETLARICDELAAMDFAFLFDPARELFAIGFSVVERRRDTSYYDLLASEARLCGYVAIALGQVPQDHWFSMSRLLVASRGEPILISWSGSMFEYLMPLLVMPNYENTLLDHTCRAAVHQQIEYGQLRGVPWGISESGYNRTDIHLNYQYRAFGVPGLGLKRGLAEDLVIAPYATALALMVAPKRACANLQLLASEGRQGTYGFYEAVDYTPARLPPGDTSATVHAYMAHHQGMSLLALLNVLQDFPMQRRFMACPLLKAADLLLQERLPNTGASVLSDDLKLEESRPLDGNSESNMRVITNPTQPAPEVHLLSNGRYHVVISSAGGGYSRWRDLAITRWREDATRDSWGTFVYLRDMATGAFWSTAYQPTLQAIKGYEAIFTQARAEFRQRPTGLDVHTEISVSPEDDVELRRITITNRSPVVRTIELTSYAEVVLATPASDALHHLNATEAEAQLYGRLASALVYADSARRASPGVLLSNRRGQNSLWSHGISGDAPLALVRISDSDHIDLVRQMIQAHSYWRMKGLTVDLVILQESASVYRDSLQSQITNLISSGIEAQLLDRPGGIFVRRLEQMSNEDRILLQAAARIVLDDDTGTLAEQLEHRRILDPVVPALAITRASAPQEPAPVPPRELIFANGLGGFTRDGHEYVITLARNQVTPAPWVNVLANPTFGTLVSESGAAYTWSENAHEFRLTPWSNDPVQDTTGEALYIRDEQTGQCWSPTPGPARGATPYVIRHGFGYTVFEHTENGIASELWVYVAMDAPVKFTVLKLRNVSGRPRRMSVFGYWEWVLGDLRHNNLLHVQTEVDLKTGALLARNPYNTEFPDRIVFVDVNDATRTVTGDRKEFIGRNGSLAQPAALKRSRLSGRVGAGLDPCGALHVVLSLAEGQERERSFRLGVGRDAADVQNLIHRFRQTGASRTALESVWDYWNRTLGAINVDTPDPSVNVMALVHAEPALARAHLLRAASRQFREGDVQHWWHPPAGRGVRTHFSDDFLWLPYTTCRYVAGVADTGVLDETVPFLEARAVKPEMEAFYDLPHRSDESATLYQHCVRAIEHGLTFGKHGLPLMGCGDWNDGMNRVGHEGRGESVWLAFFLYDVLIRFAALARAHQDLPFAERCLTQASRLQMNIELHGWDGEWYRRAYFDSGEPLGSRSNVECQIDSIPQSWSVLSGAGDPARARQAMEAVEQRLVRRPAKLIQLFDPPFDKTPLNPGYIKGYIPGVRENGGQYTHAAVWTAMAFAEMGEHEKAWGLFALLNPIHHGRTPAQIATYKVEPYVVAADVYALAPHVGRGGWTWYTGSAGWMYRLLVESLLGVHLEGDQLRLTPRLPKSWTSYKIHYRYRTTTYHITITRHPNVGMGHMLDGQPLISQTIPLVDDRCEHSVEWSV